MDQKLGFFGKVPAHGDFIERGLPRHFVGAMDEWLQGAITCSQGALGQEWLQTYLTCPLWRFGLSDGAIDSQQWVGILCPSVDSVGRYFPLIIAEKVTQGNIFTAYQNNAEWFDYVEKLALSTLENGLVAEQIEEQLDNSEPLLLKTSEPEKIEQAGWLCSGNSSEAFSHLLHKSHSQSAVSIWESKGSHSQQATTFVAKGMPPAHYYTFMLTGRWQQHSATF